MELKKNPDANIEKLKPSLMLFGLLLSLGLVLVSFEYKLIDNSQKGNLNYTADHIEEEIVPISIPNQPPPPPPPPQPTTILEIVDDEEEIQEELEIIDNEIDEDTEIEVIEEREELIVEDKIFTIVEEQPSFPGGYSELQKYLAKNIEYPNIAKDAGITGTVFVTFVVGKDGSITDAKVLRGIHDSCDKEALRVIKSMPKWTAGKQRGKPVKVQFNLPVRFTLK